VTLRSLAAPSVDHHQGDSAARV